MHRTSSKALGARVSAGSQAHYPGRELLDTGKSAYMHAYTRSCTPIVFANTNFTPLLPFETRDVNQRGER